MQVSAPNNINIYNLSAGKSLPEVKAYRIQYCFRLSIIFQYSFLFTYFFTVVI